MIFYFILLFGSIFGVITQPLPQQRPTIRILNGTSIELGCEPAELLVRTHMAPDFENPQLVRRLDWFHDDSLVASYQQDVVTDISRQWWVAGTRYELKKPFYDLKINPALPEDSGIYRCRLETDPLFAEDETGINIPVLVMVRPPAPAKPQLTASTENSLTISWTQSAGAAHRPVLRYSILVNRMDDESLRVVTTKDNQTTTVIDSLLPYTRYGLSVRAENPAGTSEFGPESVFRTLGEAPREPPMIQLLRNGTIGCVDVVWRNAPTDHNGRPVLGFRIMVHRIGSGAMREWYVKNHRQSLCSLEPDADYKLSIESDNGFGYSPAQTVNFHTEDSIPEGPPESVEVRPLTGDTVLILWKEPATPNGRVVSYQIYFQNVNSKLPCSMVRLMVNQDSSKTFAYNLTKLDPSTTYRISLTASTSKGESDKSAPVSVTTDYALPNPPRITGVDYKCGTDVLVHWTNESSPISFYKIFLENKSNTKVYNTTDSAMALTGLQPGTKYSIRLTSVLGSKYSNLTFFESALSKHQVFTIDQSKCVVQSSICTPKNENCEKVSMAGVERKPRGVSLLFILTMMASFVILIFLFTFFMKRRCSWVKKILEKADEKGGQETMSLVYDTETSETTSSTAVIVSRFDTYFTEMSRNENEGFRRQFEDIEADSEVQSEESLEEIMNSDQRLKNRYRNIGAVEKTRIKIIDSNSDDGYINANYIDSVEEKNVYIATQAPLPHTFDDFYGMIWQEKCNVIVVITNLVEDGKRKCDQYWPSSTKAPLVFGHLTVTLTAEMPNANFVHRILTLKSSKCFVPERTVHQVHLTSWPDHGTPKTVFPLLSFLNYVADIQSNGPIVVHCSAGVGRSGSFILIDSMRRHLLVCDHINIFGHLKHIRRQRQRLVQTLDQYIFCHRVVRELIKHGITRQSVPNFSNYLKFLYHQVLPDGRTRLQMQYEEVCRCPDIPQCVVPPGYVVLPGYHRSDEFLVGNWSRECSDLWNLLWERKCQTAVLFGSDAEVGDFFRSVPHRSKTESNSNSVQIRRKTVSIQPDSFELVVRKQNEEHILLKKGNEELCIRIVRLKPADLELHTWTELERIQDQLIDCHRCQMLFIDPSNSAMPYVVCALQSAACQLEQERFVDVLQFLSAYRERRCGCWTAQSNIEYIYEKVLELTTLHRP
ncbi:unnamed protein product [Bursaphelenchus xylophilus]|uniref:protein-tyrosine-phosphatase n=1 Tax=Bursaphelenchus xylophilus TaxID=6326 RepID=A0A1I7RHI7_BURXY|nr:unnamed protein product [Bursaphelenchus xylophilus]CAG9115707.1 unnamed protein product [Bursaphelenchus xylophilus]